MRIGIDGRYIQDRFPGIGRYTFSLINALAPLVPQDTLVVLCNRQPPTSRHDLGTLRRHRNLDLVYVTAGTVSLAEQVLALLGDARLRRALGCAGRELVEREYQAQAVARRVEAVLDGLSARVGSGS